MIINGHMHVAKVVLPGDEEDHRQQPCPVVIGAAKDGKKYFAGAGFEFYEDKIEVCFTDNNGDILPDGCI